MNFRVPAFVLLLASAGVLGTAVGREADRLRLPSPGWPSFAGEWVARGLSLRRVAADKQWIDILQYCGGSESVLERGANLYPMAEKLTDLDPSFVYGYAFSSAMLMWYFDRPQQAFKLLKKGIYYNEKDDSLKLYLAAFAYTEDELAGEVGILERLVTEGAPPVVRKILANIYVKRGERAKAVSLWRWIVKFSNDESERRWAEGKLREFGGR